MFRYLNFLKAIFLVLIIAHLGCKKIDELTQFNIEYNSSIVIPSSTGSNLPINLITPDVESNSESTFAVNDTRKDLIEEILLTQLNLMITSPADGNFEFLKSIEVFISAEGLSEVLIAKRENIPENIGNSLNLETVDTDLKEYIKKDNFSLRLNTITDEIITSDHHIDVRSVFFVDAKIIGQ